MRVDRFASVADLGAVVNPMLTDGQMHGGIVQGIGNALGEDAIYDRESGQLLAGSLMDYWLPRAEDVPDLRHRSLEYPSPNNMLGLKGVGELPMDVGAPAVVAAIADATGAWVTELPASPERILVVMGVTPLSHAS